MDHQPHDDHHDQKQAVSSSPTNNIRSNLNNSNALNNFIKLKHLDNDIFLARDKKHKGSLRALRVSNLELTDDIEFNLTAHDVNICRQLKHPNILPYFSNFVHKHQLCIVSPFCIYQSADRLAKPFGLPELAIAFIIRDVLKALDYIHKRAIIHRSVRASHILVDGRGRCLLTGFKYSVNCISDGKWQPYIHEYPLKARPNINWFAPEILEQNLFGYNHKSDIYSLGITCCELANGVVPFSDLQPTEMLLDKLTGNAPRLLDQTCQELVDLKPNEMSADDRDKYFVFRGRQFSNSFHSFTSALCLNFDPQRRPDAAKLLGHNFIKQTKKSPALGLLELLEPERQVSAGNSPLKGELDSTSEESRSRGSSFSSPVNRRHEEQHQLEE